MGIGKLLRKIRTSGGFGVHSPFAFGLITGVIRQRQAHYYSYPLIDKACNGHPGLTPDEGRLLFRLLCRFNPHTVLLTGEAKEPVDTIIRNAVPRATVSSVGKGLNPRPEGITFIIVDDSDGIDTAAIQNFTAPEANHGAQTVLYLRNIKTGAGKLLWSTARTVGMDFTDGTRGLVCSLHGLPRQSFTLYF